MCETLAERIQHAMDDKDITQADLAHVRLGDWKMADRPWSEYWRDAVVPTFDGLAVKTVADYSRSWKRELAPRIGARMVGATDWRFVENVMGEVESPTVQRHAFALWRKMCNLAVRDGILDRNPCDRSIRMKPHRKRAKTMYCADEVMPLLDALDGTMMQRLVMMELCAGLRHDEAVAMTAGDVMEEDGRAILNVSKAVVYQDGRLTRNETKTAFSDREVALSVHLERLMLACPWPDMQQLPTTVTHNWRQWCARHGWDYVRFGDMRKYLTGAKWY